MNAIDVPCRAIEALERARDQGLSDMEAINDALAILRLCERITYFEVEPACSKCVTDPDGTVRAVEVFVRPSLVGRK